MSPTQIPSPADSASSVHGIHAWRVARPLTMTEQFPLQLLADPWSRKWPHGEQLASLIHPRLQVIPTSVHSFLLVHGFVLLIGNNRCKTDFENFHIFIHQPYYNESELWPGLSLPFLILTLTQRALLVIKLYALHRKLPEKSIFMSSGIFSNL